MMKRVFVLLLAVLLVLSLFAGCGDKKPAADESETEAPELAKGFYVLLDDEDEPAAYLRSTGKKLTVYTAEGELLLEQVKFSWDEEGEAFVIDGKAAFTLEIAKKVTTLTIPKKSPLGLDKGSYTLEECEESDIPTGKETGSQVPDSPSSDGPAPDVPSPDAPEPGPVLTALPDGSYEVYNNGSYDGFLVLSAGTAVSYDGSGVLMGSATMEFDPSTGYTTTVENSRAVALCVYAGEDGSYLVSTVAEPEIVTVLVPSDFDPSEQDAGGEKPAPAANTVVNLATVGSHILKGSFGPEWTENWENASYGGTSAWVYSDPMIAGEYCQLMADIFLMDVTGRDDLEPDSLVEELRQQNANYLNTEIFTAEWNGIVWHYCYTTDVYDAVICGQLTLVGLRDNCLITANLSYITMSRDAMDPATDLLNAFAGTLSLS